MAVAITVDTEEAIMVVATEKVAMVKHLFNWTNVTDLFKFFLAFFSKKKTIFHLGGGYGHKGGYGGGSYGGKGGYGKRWRLFSPVFFLMIFFFFSFKEADMGVAAMAEGAMAEAIVLVVMVDTARQTTKI